MVSPLREVQLFSLLSPTIALIFAAALFVAWHHLRQNRYILILSLSFVVFAVAALSQILGIPRDIGINAVVSAILYTAAALGIIETCLARLGRPSGLWFTLPIAVVILALIVYYFYVERNLLARVYVLNFGYGILFTGAAMRMGIPRGRNLTDAILFPVILAFGLQFFIRTVATTQSGFANLDAKGFATTIFWIALNFSLILFGVILGLTFLTAIVGDVIRSLNSASETDPLTGIANRRGFDRVAAPALSKRKSTPVGLILCDIDHFKRINDTYGHPYGDTVLIEVARILATTSRPGDTVARLGGEEFAILLPDTALEGAHEAAERMRKALELTSVRGISISASFGVAERAPDETLAMLVHRADAMLYVAKRHGRNRTISDPAQAETPEAPIDLAAHRRAAATLLPGSPRS